MTTVTRTPTPGPTRPRSAFSWPWAVAGTAFAAYPLLRPYADETTMSGLAAMAGGRWLVAHLLGMVAFALLPLALARLAASSATSRPLAAAAPLSAVAAALLLPYYGGETFALHALGRQAVATGDLGLLAVVDGFRYQPLALTLFGLGLLAAAAAGALVVVALRSHGGAVRAAALLVGLGLVTYLPQFFGTPGVRIGHGVLLALGCCALALLVRTPTETVAVTTRRGA